MTIREAITATTTTTGHVVDNETMLRWLSELEGKIAFDVFGADGWEPYTEDDLDATLAVDYPWDGLYPRYLEAMTYYTDGEYDRYQNAQSMFDKAYWDFRHFMRRTHPELKPCRWKKCEGRIIV